MNLKDLQAHLNEEREHLVSVTTELNALLGNDGSMVAPAASKLPIHQHYKIFRDYIEHEDGLIDKRLLWNINIQGFLFATYGFSVQKLAEVQASGNHKSGLTGVNALDWLLLMLPILGAVISLCFFMGVIAARNAIHHLKDDWQRARQEHPNEPSVTLPGITGGGECRDENTKVKHDAHIWGLYAPLAFPLIFIAAWLALLIHYLYQR